MVIDEALAAHVKHSEFLHPIILKRIQAAAPRAKRLVFDTDSSRLLGRFIEGCTDLIIQHRQFAVPLYDTMYIEYDTYAMYDELSGEASGPIRKGSPDADTRVGFLIDYRTVYTVAKGPVASSIIPVFQYFNPRGSYALPNYGKEFPAYDFWPKRNKSVLATQFVKMSLMFGASIVEDPHYSDMVESRILDPDLSLFSDEVWYYYGGKPPADKLTPGGHQRVLTEIVGDMRNLYAILLWLNSLPHTVKFTNMPAGSKLYRGKRLALSTHNVVTIHMKGSVEVRNLFKHAVKERQHPRLHDVRGFWRHRLGIRQGCGHIWPPVPDKRHKFVCAKCGRERWWIKDHERGDKSKGHVSKEYVAEI